MTAKQHELAKAPKRIFGFLASNGFSIVLFLLLLLLTFLGTLEQTQTGLYAVQKKYFGSLALVHRFFGMIPMVLPGAHLLIVLLTINLVCGGLLRVRKGWTQLGVLIAHVGILVLIIGGFVTFRYSLNGHMTLYEQESSNEFVSHHEWEIAITEAVKQGEAKQLIIPGDQFTSLSSHDTISFHSEALPFTVSLSAFEPNCVVRPVDPSASAGRKGVDGHVLRPIPLEPQDERNMAGIYATIERPDAVSQAILWGASGPVSVNADGASWNVELRKRRWQLPFTITLDKFTRELHPRTNMPRVFMSEVTKTENGTSQKIKIAMNEPLRYKRYTFFQASWGPEGAGPGDRLFSSFAVVRNRADQFPLYACIIITFGLTLHFVTRLIRYLRAESKRQA